MLPFLTIQNELQSIWCAKNGIWDLMVTLLKPYPLSMFSGEICKNKINLFYNLLVQAQVLQEKQISPLLAKTETKSVVLKLS